MFWKNGKSFFDKFISIYLNNIDIYGDFIYICRNTLNVF